MKFFATAPKGLSELLREELMELGATEVKAQPSGVSFCGDLAVGYKACLWSRLANRVFLTLLEVELNNQEDLYEQVKNFDLARHMSADLSFAVSFSGKGMGINHTHFGALKIKDAVVDYFQDTEGVRPNVDVDYPDVQLHGHLNRNKFALSLDLSGRSMHQRGYRQGIVSKAPLKENLAAALLIRAGWPEIAKSSGVLVDPMCGSGTLLIEAVQIAADYAPGLDRASDLGCAFWKQHDEILWQDLVADADERAGVGVAWAEENLKIFGSDDHGGAIKLARRAIGQAGFANLIDLMQADFNQPWVAEDLTGGLFITNPPYGERLGDEQEVKAVYSHLGDFIKQYFVGWQAAIFTCNPALGLSLGIKARRSHDFMNGALECKLFRFDVVEENFRQAALGGGVDLAQEVERARPDLADSAGAQMFANRLRKNLRNLRRWAERNEVYAYRVYDADMPEYALALDFYSTLDSGEWLVVYEYAPPKTVNAARAKTRLYEAMAVLPEVFDLSGERIVYKVRQKQTGTSQYEKIEERKNFFTVRESGTDLRVNFTDYLDTGLFLDHREVRQLVAKLSAGKSLLNLFCYTASASAIAAVWGAKSSLSVDMSRTYLYWAKHNYLNNDLDLARHELLQADVVAWLAGGECQQKFDVIFLDPPSFSSSKRMQGVLDIQRDYVDLIYQAGGLLADGGKLVFSTNLRSFKLDAEKLSGWKIEDLTQKTLPQDFKRSARMHKVWVFSR